MNQLEEILSKTRKIARDELVGLDVATQQAIDEVAEAHNGPLDEMLLSEAAMRARTIDGLAEASARGRNGGGES